VKAGGIELLGKLENDVLYDIDAIDNDERAMQKVIIYIIKNFKKKKKAITLSTLRVTCRDYIKWQNTLQSAVACQNHYAIR
jgi:hypothetical protein